MAYYTHVGVRCVGCDLSKDELDEMAQKEQQENVGGTDMSSTDMSSTGRRQKEKWMEEDWVVVHRRYGPEFAADTKKECVGYASGQEDSKDRTTERVRRGLYRYQPQDSYNRQFLNTYWIGRPEAFEAQGITYMLDPSHYE